MARNPSRNEIKLWRGGFEKQSDAELILIRVLILWTMLFILPSILRVLAVYSLYVEQRQAAAKPMHLHCESACCCHLHRPAPVNIIHPES